MTTRHDLIQDDFQTLIEAIREERDIRRGVWKALRRDPALRTAAVEHELLDPDDDLGDLDQLAEAEEREGARRSSRPERPRVAAAGSVAAEPRFKPSRGRRTFAETVVNRPGVVAWSGRAAID